MTEQDSSTPTFTELAEAIRLREGVEGISRAMWLLCSRRIQSTRDWSQDLHIPVPVLAALRRELEKRDILEPGKGLRLTEQGKQWLETHFGSIEIPHTRCPVCQGRGNIIPAEAMPLLEEFENLCDERPQADVTLDQSHATAETGIRKAMYLLEKGWLGQSLLFVGDDDLISIACQLVRNRFLSNADSGEICVLDIDSRYLDLITILSNDEISTQVYDVRDELPDDFVSEFNVTITDPAYTVKGVTTFSARCAQALKPDGKLLLSMPVIDPHARKQIQLNLNQSGLVLNEIHPDFNEYTGASIHAHVTSLFIWQKTSVAQDKSAEMRYNAFYTREQKEQH